MKLSLLASLAALACLGPQIGLFESKAERPEGCHNYNPEPRCTEEERNHWREQFGLPSLEAIHRRLGTGRDLIIGMVRMKRAGSLAIVMHENRSGTATAEIYRTPRDRKPVRQRQALRVTIPKQDWRMIVAKGKELPDAFGREEVYVCGASFMIEFRDAQGAVRSPVGDSCGDEPRGEYFDLLAMAVLKQMPRCRLRELGQWETSLDLLEECGLLSAQHRG